MSATRDGVWQLRSVDGALVRKVARRHSLDALTATILTRRGITDSADVTSFLDRRQTDAAPAISVASMRRAVQLIAHHRPSGIHVFGDPDVDGIAAVALLVETFRRARVTTTWHMPDAGGRHGVMKEDLVRARRGGARLLVTADCGMGDTAVLESAQEMGLDVIITDHHQPVGAVPEVGAVLNPVIAEGARAGVSLAAAAVALAFAEYVLTREGEDRSTLAELAMLGTIADRMPLIGRNRAIVAAGLAVLERSQRIGLTALCARLELSRQRVSADDVARSINPIIGAAARFGRAALAVELLLTRDYAGCGELVSELIELDARRRRETAAAWRRLLPRARQSVDAHPLAQCVLVDDIELARGLTGPIAYRLSRLLSRPVGVVAYVDGKAAGSLRSPDEALDMAHLLDMVPELLESYGGHPQAAGFVALAESVEQLRARWSQGGAEVAVGSASGRSRPLDADVPSRFLTPDLALVVRRFAPYGVGNPTLKMRTAGLAIEAIELVGASSRHAKLLLVAEASRWPAWYWNAGSRAGAQFAVGDRVDVVYELREDKYTGLLEMVVSDLWRAP